MQKAPDKPRILFIASNIPTPKRKSNKVVMTIAHKLTAWCDISVMHPAEIAPFPFNLMAKYRNIAGKQSWEDDGIMVRPFRYIRLIGKKSAFLLLPSYKKKLQKYCKQFGIPQLVHAHFALPDGDFAYQIAELFDIPYVISFRKSDIGFLELSKNCSTKNLIHRVLSNAGQIIVHNAAQQELLSKVGYKSVLLPHGIEKDFFAKKEQTNTSDSLSIASIGELVPTKHIDWVIRAVKNYKGNKKITLKIAGKGPMRPELEALARGHDNIQLLGQIDHERIGELLRETDIFALPSVNETFGLVYLEAAAHQNAVIATKGTGIWGVFEDQNEMLFCDSSDSFDELLYRLIDDDKLRNELAENAYFKAFENYQWEKIIERYIELYDGLSKKIDY